MSHQRWRIFSPTFLVSFAGFFALLTAADNKSDAKVSYNRDVRPILSENCFNCHGVSPPTRKAATAPCVDRA